MLPPLIIYYKFSYTKLKRGKISGKFLTHVAFEKHPIGGIILGKWRHKFQVMSSKGRLGVKGERGGVTSRLKVEKLLHKGWWVLWGAYKKGFPTGALCLRWYIYKGAG
jgi:hypothetical protein